MLKKIKDGTLKLAVIYAVMEKADNAVAGDTSFEWNDIGSWSSLKTMLPSDENVNTYKGRIAILNAKKQCLVQ